MEAEENQENINEGMNYHILKIRFKSNSLSLYGLILIIFNTRQELDLYHTIVSSYSNVYDLEPYFGWEKYEEFIVKSKWEGNYNPNMTALIQELFQNIASEDTQIIQLYEYIKDYDYDNIDIFIFDVINRIIHDKNLIMETGIQEVSENEFRETKYEELKKVDTKDTKDSAYSLEEGSVMLPIQLILAPVSGKPIYELKVGDIIMVKIVPDTDRANYFIDLLDLRVENHVKPVPCEVIDIKSGDKGDPVEIVTQIGPGIYGKCLEDEKQVKLRIYDSTVDGPLSKKDMTKKGATQKNIKPPPDTDLENIGAISIKAIYLIIGLLAIIFLIFFLIYISI